MFNSTDRNINIFMIQFYADKFSIKFQRDERGRARAHKRIKYNPPIWTPSHYHRYNQIFWKCRGMITRKWHSVDGPDGAFVSHTIPFFFSWQFFFFYSIFSVTSYSIFSVTW